MKKLFFLILLTLSVTIKSCSKDESSEGRIQLIVSEKNSDTKSSIQNKENNADVIFTDFQISIRDVIFKNEDDSNSSLDTDNVQFRGPYQIDLLNDSDALSQTIGDVVVPAGNYKELRFKFHKSQDLPSTHKLFDKSIYMEGTIDGTPFVFWHDTSENLDIGKTTGVVVADGTVNFTVQFDISQFLSSLHTIDLSTAVDGNANGIIEIYQNDEDGNKEIAKLLKENIKATAKILDN